MKTNRVKYPKANLGGQSRKRAIRRRTNAAEKNRKRNRILIGAAVAAVVVTGVVIYKRDKGKYSELPQPPADAPIPPMYPKPPMPQP